MSKPNPTRVRKGLAKRGPVAPRVSVAMPEPAPVPGRPARTGSAGSRSGRVLVGGHFASEVQRALRITAAEEGTTVQALLAEGINTVFARRGKPAIAGSGQPRRR